MKQLDGAERGQASTCQPRMMTASSHTEKGSFLTDGSSWLHQRRRHDLPERPGISLAMSVQVPGLPFICRSRDRRDHWRSHSGAVRNNSEGS